MNDEGQIIPDMGEFYPPLLSAERQAKWVLTTPDLISTQGDKAFSRLTGLQLEGSQTDTFANSYIQSSNN